MSARLASIASSILPLGVVFCVGCFSPSDTVQNETEAETEAASTSGTTDSGPPTTTMTLTATTAADATSPTTEPTTNPTTDDTTSPTSGPTSEGSSTSTESDASTTGTPVECGNRILEDDEECDDGNLVSADGCNDDCRISGVVEWVAVDGDIDTDGAGGVAVDPQGNVYATGSYFRDGADDDVWIASWDRDGAMRWTVTHDISAGGYDRGIDARFFEGATPALQVLTSGPTGQEVRRVDPANGDLLTQAPLAFPAGQTNPFATDLALGLTSGYWAGRGTVAGTSHSALGRYSATILGSQASVDGGEGIYHGVDLAPGGAVIVGGEATGVGFVEFRNGLNLSLVHAVANLPAIVGVAAMPNGDAVGVATTFVAGQGNNIWVGRFAVGQALPLWTETWNGPDNDDDSGRQVAVGSDGSIVVIGSTRDGAASTTVALRFGADGGAPYWATNIYAEGESTYAADVVVDNNDLSVSVTGGWFNPSAEDDLFVAHLRP